MADSEANKQIARKVEAAWNEGRLDELDQHFADNFESHSVMPGMPPTLQTAKMAHQMALKAFPDRKIEILDVIAEGDKVLLRGRVTGTNTGGAFWFNVPEPNNKAIDFESWIVYRIKDGKIVEAWGINDGMMAMAQLGSLQMGAPPVPAGN